MPIYELACEDGHRSETLQASTDPLPACPACGSVEAWRVSERCPASQASS